MGKWLEWDPNPLKINNQVYANEGLNDIIQNKKEISEKTEIFKNNLKNEQIEKSITNNKLISDESEEITPKESEENKETIINSIFK